MVKGLFAAPSAAGSARGEKVDTPLVAPTIGRLFAPDAAAGSPTAEKERTPAVLPTTGEPFADGTL